jgi:hypothetical protein
MQVKVTHLGHPSRQVYRHTAQSTLTEALTERLLFDLGRTTGTLSNISDSGLMCILTLNSGVLVA